LRWAWPSPGSERIAWSRCAPGRIPEPLGPRACKARRRRRRTPLRCQMPPERPRVSGVGGLYALGILSRQARPAANLGTSDRLSPDDSLHPVPAGLNADLGEMIRTNFATSSARFACTSRTVWLISAPRYRAQPPTALRRRLIVCASPHTAQHRC
jgi:hypothetical protein